jgi:hypothetical protein
MSNYQINAIVTRALADQDFQKAILNGQRRERLQDFNLSPELEETIMSFKRGSIDQMIYQLNDLSMSLTGRKDTGVSRSFHAADQGFSRSQ